MIKVKIEPVPANVRGGGGFGTAVWVDDKLTDGASCFVNQSHAIHFAIRALQREQRKCEKEEKRTCSSIG